MSPRSLPPAVKLSNNCHKTGQIPSYFEVSGKNFSLVETFCDAPEGVGSITLQDKIVDFRNCVQAKIKAPYFDQKALCEYYNAVMKKDLIANEGSDEAEYDNDDDIAQAQAAQLGLSIPTTSSVIKMFSAVSECYAPIEIQCGLDGNTVAALDNILEQYSECLLLGKCVQKSHTGKLDILSARQEKFIDDVLSSRTKSISEKWAETAATEQQTKNIEILSSTVHELPSVTIGLLTPEVLLHEWTAGSNYQGSLL